MTMAWEEINWHVKALKKQLENDPTSLDYVFEACKKAVNSKDWPFSISQLRDDIIPKILPYEFYEEEQGAWGAAHVAFYRYMLSDPDFEGASRDSLDIGFVNKLTALQAIYSEDFVKYEFFSHETRAPYAIKKQPYSSTENDVLRISRVDGEFLDLQMSVHDYFNLINGLLENLPTDSLNRSYDDNRPAQRIKGIKNELEKLKSNRWLEDDEDDTIEEN